MAPEAWLRGAISGVDPLLQPVLRSFEQIREDLREWTTGIGPGDLWSSVAGLTPIGFQLRHIAGSTGRLMTYVAGGQLSEQQIREMKEESTPGATLEELLAGVDTAFAKAGSMVRGLRPEQLAEPRKVGRRELPTTVAGLLHHIAEHGQRHVGGVIAAAKAVRARA
ncbi:MAG: DinB family protein [Bryobacteraceae bacterium]|nr:DinB family protein [Bryobacteraceae bacterium]